MSSNPIVSVNHVNKKLCRSLRRSMMYGIQDIGKEVLGLSPKNDTLRPDEFWAINDVSFTLSPGDCMGIIGANGAGKSTLLKMINGIIWPDGGQIKLNGRVGSLIEVGAGFHPQLSGRENIYINGSILGLTKQEVKKRFDEIVEFAELSDFIDSPVKQYSSGMYVRLGFSIAIHAAPEILLVDEILAVGDAAFQRKCLKSMKQFSDDGGILVFVTHNMLAVHSIGTKSLVLDKGRNVYMGSTQQAAEIYYQCTVNRNQNQNNIVEKNLGEMRYGTGELQVAKIRYRPEGTNEDFVETNKPLLAGKPAEVSIDIIAKDDAQKVDVGFSIWEQSDLPLVTFNTQTVGKTITKIKAGQTVTLNFKFTCPLSSGDYKLSAGAINSETNTFYDRRVHWLNLKVVASGDEFGLLTVPYNISIEKKHVEMT